MTTTNIPHPIEQIIRQRILILDGTLIQRHQPNAHYYGGSIMQTHVKPLPILGEKEASFDPTTYALRGDLCRL